MQTGRRSLMDVQGTLKIQQPQMETLDRRAANLYR
jgi:hypothetical protein